MFTLTNFLSITWTYNLPLHSQKQQLCKEIPKSMDLTPSQHFSHTIPTSKVNISIVCMVFIKCPDFGYKILELQFFQLTPENRNQNPYYPRGGKYRFLSPRTMSWGSLVYDRVKRIVAAPTMLQIENILKDTLYIAIESWAYPAFCRSMNYLRNDKVSYVPCWSEIELLAVGRSNAHVMSSRV